MNIALSIKNISKTFRDGSTCLPVLKDIDLEIKEKEFFIILGPSGSGKSTLLRIVSGLEQEYAGQIRLSDAVTPKDFGFVFQQFALLPWLTVFENVEVGLIARGLAKDVRQKKVMDELRVLGLEKFADSAPRELSGGMKQRVGLARALVTDPRILFMDESFSELDSFTAEELRKVLLEIWERRKVTIVMVTHLVEEALELGDRIAILTPRPGRIESIIHNPLSRPRQERSQEFYDLEDKITKIIRP